MKLQNFALVDLRGYHCFCVLALVLFYFGVLNDLLAMNQVLNVLSSRLQVFGFKTLVNFVLKECGVFIQFYWHFLGNCDLISV